MIGEEEDEATRIQQPLTPEATTFETPAPIARGSAFRALFTAGPSKQKQPEQPRTLRTEQEQKRKETAKGKEKASAPDVTSIPHKQGFLSSSHLSPNPDTKPNPAMAPNTAFKPPKPRVFSGKSSDKDPAVFDAWKQEVLDYLDLSGIDPKHQLVVLQYFVSETAKDYYTTKRKEHTDAVTPCRVNTLLRAQAKLYAEALSLYTPHNGTQVHTVAYRGAVEYVVSIIAVNGVL